MSRKRVEHDLPGLGTLHPAFHGFEPRQNALRALTDLLRTTVSRVRVDHPRHFYTQREIAEFFHVPLRTVALACRRLAGEGLLRCVRGSATFVLGRRLQPRSPPRGVVGLPVWTGGFVLLPTWRRFFACLEEELRRVNLVTDMVFYRQGEEADPDFGERLLAHHLDHIVWLYPLPRSQPIIARLADGGVGTLAVVQPPGLPLHGLRQYPIHWERAYLAALAHWQREGVREVIVIGPAESPAVQPVHAALVQTGLRGTFPLRFDPEASLGSRTGVVFTDEFAQLHYWRGAPGAMARLMGQTHVLVKNSLPVPSVPHGLQVDLVAADWEKLARRLARDIAAPSRKAPGQSQVVQARYSPCVLAHEICEDL